MVKVPACAPGLVGLKRTVSWVEAAAAMVMGTSGVTVNTEFEEVIAVTCSAALPVLETASGSVADLPTFTVPKLRDDGETAILGATAAVPVPDSSIDTDGCAASLLEMVR